MELINKIKDKFKGDGEELTFDELVTIENFSRETKDHPFKEFDKVFKVFHSIESAHRAKQWQFLKKDCGVHETIIDENFSGGFAEDYKKFNKILNCEFNRLKHSKDL